MLFKKKENGAKPEKSGQKEMYDLFKNTFDAAKWTYTAHPEEFAIASQFMGDDLPIKILIRVADQTFHIICILDFVAESNKFQEVCWNLNCINKDLLFGSFVLDPEDGRVTFEYAMIFAESDLSQSFIASMIRMLVDTVDKYDGDLKKIAEKVQRPFDDAMYG